MLLSSLYSGWWLGDVVCEVKALKNEVQSRSNLGLTPGSRPLTTWTWTYKVGSGPPSHWPRPLDLWGQSGPDPGP